MDVLSPKISTVTNPGDEFVVLKSDPTDASVREIEDLVLNNIVDSDYVYLRNP